MLPWMNSNWQVVEREIEPPAQAFVGFVPYFAILSHEPIFVARFS